MPSQGWKVRIPVTRSQGRKESLSVGRRGGIRGAFLEGTTELELTGRYD